MAITLMHFWYSATQAVRWFRLPVALIDGVEYVYTACESTKEEGATQPKGYRFDDWGYVGKGVILRAGLWQDERKKKIQAVAKAVRSKRQWETHQTRQ